MSKNFMCYSSDEADCIGSGDVSLSLDMTSPDLARYYY